MSLTNNLYGGLSSSGIKTGRIYQRSLEADKFKISDELRGDIHTQLATDNVILTFVGGWVFTCDVILVAV